MSSLFNYMCFKYHSLAYLFTFFSFGWGVQQVYFVFVCVRTHEAHTRKSIAFPGIVTGHFSTFLIIPIYQLFFFVGAFCYQFKKSLPTSKSWRFSIDFQKLYCFTYNIYIYHLLGTDFCIQDDLVIRVSFLFLHMDSQLTEYHLQRNSCPHHSLATHLS